MFVLVVSLGSVPSENLLQGAQTFRADTQTSEDSAGSGTEVAKQTASLMAFLSSKELTTSAKSSRVWYVGDGLGTIPKKVYE